MALIKTGTVSAVTACQQ